VSRLRQGDPFQKGVNQGPLINEPAMQKVCQSEEDLNHLLLPLPVALCTHAHTHTPPPHAHLQNPPPTYMQVEQHVSDAVSRGGEIVVGGTRNLSLGSSYFQPSVLVGANTDMQLAHEETFGPIAPIIQCVAPAVLYRSLCSLVPTLHWNQTSVASLPLCAGNQASICIASFPLCYTGNQASICIASFPLCYTGNQASICIASFPLCYTGNQASICTASFPLCYTGNQASIASLPLCACWITS